MPTTHRPIKVITFYDEKGWAWWHRAHHVRANLGPAVELDILRNGERFDAGAYDLILLFEHYLLNLVPNAPRGKVILGSSCPRLTHEMLEWLKKENCLAGMVNNLESHRRFAGEARLYCCQNGVDADLFAPAQGKPAGIRACWVGNSKSIGNKGLDLIREACRRAGVPLLALDKAELGGEGTALTQEQVRDRIYHQSSFYICASEFEGTPNPMLESLACGLPVVSTRVGNAPELIRDGYNGFLADRTVESLEAAIRRLAASDAAALSRNARQSILDGWTWKHRAKAYEAMFLELAPLATGSPESPGRLQAFPSGAPPAPERPAARVAVANEANAGKKKGFTGMVAVPFLASKLEERKLYLEDLKAKAESLRNRPDDFDTVLGAALDAIRLGDYGLARDFTACAAGMTRYYNEVIRDLTLHIRARERKQGKPAAADPAAALGRGTIRVAMLTYNALEYTQQCLHSLLTRTRRPLEIHIRENASSDDTPRWLRELNHPQVHVEFGRENRGVPGGRNRLIEMIRPVAHPDDFVVFLDNDIEILEGWEDHFLEFFGSHPGAGIASALGQRMIVEERGRSLKEPPYEDPQPVDVALGGYACWMRAGAMLEVGGYDENLGLFWHEDDDFCVRALSKGIDVWAVPGAPLIHHGHKSGVALTGLSQGGSPKNLAYLADKWRKLGLVLANGEIDRTAVARKAADRGTVDREALRDRAGAPVHLHAESAPTAAAPAPSADGSAPAGPLPGINIYGRFGAPAGTRAGRIARMLSDAGVPIALVQCGRRVPMQGDAELASRLVPESEEAPHATDLFLLDPPDIEVWRRGKRLSGSRRPFEVMMPAAPLRIPESWFPILDSADLVLAESREFLIHASSRLSQAAVRYVSPWAPAPSRAPSPAEAAAARERWGIPVSETVTVFGVRFDAAGDIGFQNPMDAIHAFVKAFGSRGDVALCVHIENSGARAEYALFLERLRNATRAYANVRYVAADLPAPEAAALLAACDAIVSLRRGGPPDASIIEGMRLGIPALALAHSGNLDILHEGNSLLAKPLREPIDPESPTAAGAGAEARYWAGADVEEVAGLMKRLLERPGLRRELGERAKADVSGLLAAWGIAEALRRAGSAAHAEDRDRSGGGQWLPGPRASGDASGWRILFQNRPSADAAPGGDTMVMDRYREGLRKLGAVVDVRHDAGADYRRYDMVHLYNLVLPDTIEPLARAARKAGVPYVVQALQEDQTGYLGRARAAAQALAAYVDAGQPGGSASAVAEGTGRAEVTRTDSSAFAAAHAAAILCNSAEEADYVRRLHAGARCTVNPYGADAPPRGTGPEAFRKAFGAEDFLLCVGRLEMRKNQLALLAALEDEDITLVLADGGICYMPDYASYCRRFRRRGRTLFTGRMSRDMLLSCYSAARAHILPSWQELPGLVTLEAALSGCNVAATPHGGIREYMGESCSYFEPGDLAGMRAAALAAMRAPKDGAAGRVASAFTWEKSAAGVFAAYRAAAGARDGASGMGPATDRSAAAAASSRES